MRLRALAVLGLRDWAKALDAQARPRPGVRMMGGGVIEAEIACARVTVDIFPVHFARTFSMQRLGLRSDGRSVGRLFPKGVFYRGEAAAIEICRDGDSLRVMVCCARCAGVAGRDGSGA